MGQDRRDEENPPHHGPQLPFLAALSHMTCLSSGQRFCGERLEFVGFCGERLEFEMCCQ